MRVALTATSTRVRSHVTAKLLNSNQYQMSENRSFINEIEFGILF